MTELESSSDETKKGMSGNGEAFSKERETDILEDENGRDSVAASLSFSGNSSSFSYNTLSGNEPRTSAGVDNFTHTSVQRRMKTDNSLAFNGEYGSDEASPLPSPQTPTGGISSQDHGGLLNHGHKCTDALDSTYTTHASREDELASLSTDIDDSIEQLNQLILDLDPTFIPALPGSDRLSRSTSLNSGCLSDKGNTHVTGWKRQKQISDVTDYSSLWMPNVACPDPGSRGEEPRSFGGSLVDRPPFLSPQHKFKGVDFNGRSDSSEFIPPTPTFPVTPPTPYDSRSFLDSANHTGSSDGELFRSDMSVSSASCPRVFGSMCSVSSSSPLPHSDRCTPPPVWHQHTPNSSQPSTPIKRSTPNVQGSPWGARKGSVGGPEVHVATESPDVCSLLTVNGNLEHSLLEAMRDLRVLSLGGDEDLPPLLPEKRRGGEGGELGSCSTSLSAVSSLHSGVDVSLPFSSLTPDLLSGTPSSGAEFGSKQDTVKFVQDISKFWYKPDISRDQAISVLKDKVAGSFIVRDSHSFQGAYGLAMKVATPPPSVLHSAHSKKVADASNELVRHFLIECTQKGVRLKGCPNEPYFGSLTALVCQHSTTPLALPCKLILPDRDPLEELSDSSANTATNSAAELLKQGAACNVWYLGSVELESLTGHQAVQKATTLTLAMDPPSASTVVHFKVSAQGITLTDNQRKLFFRRHYAVNTVIFCSLDPQGRRWTRGNDSTAKIFGFVARKSQSETENICHLFAEHDPEQPASAIVNFVSKVMIGSHKK
ncbi:si:ch211-191a24.3 isoform X2 [Nerophis ophidion]|uniref:si:ch211-191a24.3 isoform X2 n=1 Tax=Nerophis ophidion TaxID=159077 RepID=UPI002ADF0DED|nr:si:ch211-191a24.3 isoform X2 [Nerophis ophidion]